jgi:hypothetical protein
VLHSGLEPPQPSYAKRGETSLRQLTVGFSTSVGSVQRSMGVYQRVSARWFERLLAEFGFEVWIGDPVKIKTKRVKKRKTDREDARLLLRLMREDNFPQIWIPSPENRDLRQLLWHRHRLVQMRCPVSAFTRTYVNQQRKNARSALNGASRMKRCCVRCNPASRNPSTWFARYSAHSNQIRKVDRG